MSKEEYHNDISMFGKLILEKLKKLRIFVWGAQPLGAEVSKNITYYSIDELVIYDQEKIGYEDLSGSTYGKEEDVQQGFTRAEICQRWLKKVQNVVQVEVCQQFILEESLKNIDVIILTQILKEKQMIDINNYCRENNIGFILVGVYGLYCYCMVDFGNNYKLHDRDGEDTYPFMISSISKSNPGVVNLVNQHKHNFQTGDFIRITEVDGMHQVNGQEPRPVKVIDDYSFSIEDTTYYAQYQKGGFAELVKVPHKIKFNSLDSLINGTKPQILNSKYKNIKLLHMFWKCLIQYKTKYDKLPEIFNKEAYEQIAQIAQEINEQNKEKSPEFYIENIDQSQLKLLTKYCTVQIAPLCIGWAGLVTKEILSFCGKYEPIRQIFHIDFFELSPKYEVKADQVEKYKNTRYYQQVALIGAEGQEKLINYKIGIMGAGSNGCELARNLVLMGVCTGENGLLDILDADTFKTFNLHSHQWITEDAVDKSKVEVLSKNILRLNPQTKIRCTQKLADKSSENDLGDDYWKNIDVIFNCTDKKAAKQYLLEKSLWYNKVLIDQSLDALKGSTHSIIPHITDIPDLQKDDFLSGRFDFDKDIIMNYPYLQIHDIIWAKEIFEQLFVENLRELKQYINHPQQYIHQYQSLFKLNMNYQTKLLIIHCLVTKKNYLELKDIVQLSKEIFELYFNERIYRLIASHIPADNQEDEKFWVGYKKIPQIIQYNPQNQMIIRFISIVTHLYINLFQLDVPNDKLTEENIKKILLIQYNSPEDQQQQYWNLQSYELKDEKDIENFEKILQECAKPAMIPQLKIGICNQTSEYFREKYIDFLDTSSNLRSQCYQHGKVPRYKVENIAFEMNRRSLFPQSIITSMAALELFKYATNQDISDYRNIKFDLTQNKFDFIPPVNAKIIQKDPNIVYIPQPFTVWEKIIVDKPVSIEELIDYFSNKYDVFINSIYVNNVQVWQSNPLESKDNLNIMKMNLLKAYEFESGTKLAKGINQLPIMITAKTKNHQPAMFPTIKYIHQHESENI
ncbi:hypothetical protein ABPG72_004618 [Tetrahymena utriculariae]